MESEIEFDGMEEDEMFPLLLQSISLYSRVRDVFTRVISEGRANDESFASFSGSQIAFFCDRAQSITLLVQSWRLWDADILMRSLIESATRLLFVSTRDPQARAEAILELDVDLPEIHHVERSEKAKTAARNATDPEDALIFRGVALRAEEEAELRSRWPKAKRKALKQKWSFSELVPQLERVNEPSIDLSSFGSALYSYSLGSHFIHADRAAIELMRDRSLREEAERTLLERSHYARVATEPTMLLFLCLRGVAHAFGMQLDTKDLTLDLVALCNSADRHHRDFSASQADFYASRGVT
jgi:hypothetical protein